MTNPLAQPDLRTRLRELRKANGWTLAEVAERLGTTPQTVSRLETNVMTVSTDWLQKFAAVFDVSAADLIAERATGTISVIGTVCMNGRILPQASAPLPVPLTLDNAVAAKADENIGPYAKGTFVIGVKLSGRNFNSALGHPSICETSQGSLWLARPIEGLDGKITLVPLAAGDVQYDVTLNWVARVQMDVRLAE